MAGNLFFLYGPPGSGKSTLGKRLARSLDLPFIDLDSRIEERSGKAIAEIFASQGEAAFRGLEAECLRECVASGPGVVALGGGSLLDADSRKLVEAAGQVLCLNAALEKLLARTSAAPGVRPLLGSDERQGAQLADLLRRRAAHYASFPLRLETSKTSRAELTEQAQMLLGAFRVAGMGSPYDVRVFPGGLDQVGEMLCERGLGGPVAVVSDDHVGPLYASRALRALETAGLPAFNVTILAGETHKTLRTVEHLWKSFLQGGLDRGSTVLALGGGVVGDLAGFAAATYLRGIRWVTLPTSLLSMVDASLGGKTGADLPQGKNLVGAFHPPALVLADPRVLNTLPEAEQRSGLGEVVKHGVISDSHLFESCAVSWKELRANGWDELVRRAIAVKVRVIEADPYEKGQRASLNLGHTIGHAVELASDFHLRHGEAVAIGMVAEARLAETMGLAQPGLAQIISSVLTGLELPVQIPANFERARLLPALLLDKKRASGRVRFALPLRVGEVRWGVLVEAELVQKILEEA